MRDASEIAAEMPAQWREPSRTTDGQAGPADEAHEMLMLALKRVFKEFRRMYGARFTSRFVGRNDDEIATDVEETRRVWARQLHGLTGDDLARGLAALPNRPERDVGWPPSADEFRKLCLPRHREPYERAEFQGNALPHQALSVEENRKRAPSLRAALRGDYPREIG